MSAFKYSFRQSALCVLLFPILFLAFCPSLARAAAATTTTALTITASTGTVTSVATGTAVTLTATVKAGSTLVPAGTVSFCDAAAVHCTDIHVIGARQLTTAGTASLKFVPGPGAHSYKAEFTGTTTDSASSSAATSLTVNGAPTATTIAQSGSTGNYTLKATVTGKGSVTGPTGEVSFIDTSAQNATLGSAALGSSTEAFSWVTAQSPGTAAQPASIVVADFNGDGIADLAVGTNGTAASKDVGSINLLLGNGDGTFQTAKTFTGLSGNQLIVAAAFVTAGSQDVLAVNNSSATTDNGLLFLGDGKGGLGTPTTISLGIDTVNSVITGDFNGDGKLDFIVAGEAFGVPAFNVFLGNGNGTFNSGTLNATSNVTITGLAAGDFTGQGALDLAVIHADGTVDIFLQDGAGDFYPNAGTTAGSSPTAVAVGDFNGDGKADLAITNSSQENVSILLGDGTGNFAASASPATGSLPRAIVVGDWNADGIADLAIANSGSASVSILLGKGNGTFTAEPGLDTGNTPFSLAAGKFNGLNTADLAVVNEDPSSSGSTGTATILLSLLSQSATASVGGINPAAAGTHLVDASYAGDAIYHASVSGTTSLNGSGKQAAAPVLSPAAGTYSVAQKVTLTDATAGASIYYTINGTTPTSASTKYTSAISVTATETIKAIAIVSGYSNSAVASATYSIQAATLTVSSSSLTFPSTVVGATSAVQTVTLKNTGSSSVTLGSVSITGTYASSFTQASTNCPGTIAAGASCTVNFEFKPTAAGSLSATWSIADNASGSPRTVTLKGTATAASTMTLTLSPASLSFPSTNVGATSLAQSFTLKNTGTSSVTLGSVGITGTNASSFIQSSTNCPGTIAAGASCAVNLEFKPTAAGALSATWAISDNASNSPQKVSLAGTGTAAPTMTLTVSPTSLTFPSTKVGSTSSVQSFTLKNTGSASVTLGSVSITGTNASSFSQTSTNCPGTVTAGSSCTVNLEFKPMAAGTLSATWAITDNASNSPQKVTLTGMGNSPSTLTITLSPTSLTFPSTKVGSTSPVQSFTLKNTGSASVTLGSVSITGTNASSFLQSATNCPGTVTAGASCTVNLEFKPTAAGSLSATWSIADNASGSPQTVALKGTATTATTLSLAFSPTSLTFPSTGVGATSAAQVVTLKNTGSAAVTLGSTSFTGTNSGSFLKSSTNCPGTVAAGASCTVSLEFKPTASRTLSATFNLTDNAANSPQTVALIGTASGAAITPSPSTLSYPFTSINTSSPAQTVTFKNGAATAVTSLSVSLTGNGATSYSKTQTCGTTLASGASCTVSVTFSPKTDGTFAASLQFTGSGVSTVVSLSGTCSDPTSIAPDANTYVFDTTEGDIYVELRPDVAPKNVANFLSYVKNGTYTSSIIHRVVAGFINQGGGYKLKSAGQIVAPTTAAPVVNEFKLSNVRGTLSMAKVSNDPNSATDQFFFNAADNSASLDTQDGGYTVIGQIVGVQGVNIGSASESLAVMDAINTVPVFAFQSPFDSIPLVNYTSGTTVTSSNYVYVNSITQYAAKNNGPATPIFSINTGTYSGPQTIKLTDSTPNATIFYYLFGSNSQSVIQYTGPFTVSSSQYVVAYATAPGYSSESYDNYEYYNIQ